jgi:predicted cupin superfamily sugar epimerase
MLSPRDIIELLRLEPLAAEGGYYRETYRSEIVIPPGSLPGEYGGGRNASTAIYYLLTPQDFSAMHRVRSDEIFHFYAGDPVEMLLLYPGGNGRVVRVGSDLAAELTPQVIVPAGVWQGARLAPGGRWALLGTTVAPGFEFADYEHADRAQLLARYPEFDELISVLTRG